MEKETVEEYFARGGRITHIPAGKSSGLEFGNSPWVQKRNKARLEKEKEEAEEANSSS